MAASMYVQLSPGAYTFGVTSDDGFEFSTGPTLGSTNMTLGEFDAGRGSSETTFSFIVQANGVYPMRLLHFKAQLGGGGVELYSVNPNNGTRILLNDPSNTNAVKVYWGPPVVTRIPLTIQKIGTNAVITWSDPTFSLQSAPLASGTYTTIAGATNPYTNAIAGSQKFFRLIH
jgi:hypothetical protein